MNAFSSDPAELEITPEAPKGAEALVAEPGLASMSEAIKVRASTLLPVAEEPRRFGPSIRWGINE